MDNKKIFLIFALFFLIGVSFASAADYQYSSQQRRGVTYTQQDVNTYWPILGDRETCEARQDILLNVAPFGCQPAVVRSDLLAEQNVPVFCQIDALQVNPLIDIREIKNIRFSGEYPEGVVGAGFHPARAALRSRDNLLGDPLINNIGYVVLVLKRNPKEKELPDFVNVTLQAQIQYNAGNALGVGRAEFLLKPTSESEWDNQKLKQSFWKGRYFVRLEEAYDDYAIVSIYSGDKKVTSVKVEKGKMSREIYMPGFYCQAGIQVAYDGFESDQDRAVLEIKHEDGSVDTQEVYSRSRVLEKCVVRNLNAGGEYNGSIELNCGRDRLNLKLNPLFIEQDENGNNITFNYQNIDSGKADFEQSFKDSVRDYRNVAEDFPSEKMNEGEGSFIGIEALDEAIDLARGVSGKRQTLIELLELKSEIYPESAVDTLQELDIVKGKANTEQSSGFVEVDGKTYLISVKRFISKAAGEKSSAVLSFSEQPGLTEQVVLGEKLDSKTKLNGVSKISSINFERVLDADRIGVSIACADEVKRVRGGSVVLELGKDAIEVCEGSKIKLENLDWKSSAKIRLLPKARGTEIETNLTVGVGIEKRAIQLSPEKTEEMIENLNKSIQKWEGISNKLGKVVTGLKGACFATAGVLAVKNFVSGMSGEALARQKVMQGSDVSDGWNKICAKEISSGKYQTLTECFNDNRDLINRQVSEQTEAIQTVNDKIKEIQNKPENSQPGLFSSDSVIQTNAKKEYAEYLNSKFGTELDTSERALDFVSMDELRELHNLKLLESKSSFDKDKVSNEYSIKLKNVQSSTEFGQGLSNSEGYAEGLNTGVTLIGPGAENAKVYSVRPVPLSSDRTKASGKTLNGLNSQVDADSVAVVRATKKIENRDGSTVFDKGRDLLIVGKDSNGKFEPVEVYEINGDSREELTLGDKVYSTSGESGKKIADFTAEYQINSFQSVGTKELRNPISQEFKTVEYFVSGPYKDYAARVPIDVNNGWYVEVDGTLTLNDKIRAYDSSGQPRIFDICNVGVDMRIDSGDLCQTIHVGVNDNYPVLGLSSQESKQLINNAQLALIEATRQKGKGVVNIKGVGAIQTGKGLAAVPKTNCQDFMSAEDCQLLFNVCDPVICPETRCNLGGKYQVANVVQSGIVGSALLCLPNIREGIAVPVCLTGIQAGIDGFVSILRNHRDCLSESLATGQHVGICDQIYSIYLCEFFWNQIAPFADLILPTIVETALGQGARGGGEYLTVTSAWENTKASVEYFTQSYAANSIKAFQVRSIAEAGTQVCKSFISAKAPSSFESLVEPDSPPQFHAWFSSTRFSDATVPATSHYKAFYHIFAGKDSGVWYSVYLKSPETSTYYGIAPTVSVANGFIAKGQYASETKDFTAPEGYKELCVRVNDQEECGFSQVSTSFAVNYARDQFVSDELTQGKVTKENECVYGSSSVGSLLNPNLQAGVSEALNPDISKRGVVRICASLNPGASTDPARFVDVGYCDDPKTRCWLDKESVDKALTKGNELTRNSTLTELDNIAKQNLRDKGFVADNGEFVTRIKLIKGSKREANTLEWFKEKYSGEIKDLSELNKDSEYLLFVIDSLYDKLILNQHRALVLKMRGDVEKVRAMALARNYNLLANGDKVQVSLGEDPLNLIGEKIYDSESGEEWNVKSFDGQEYLIYNSISRKMALSEWNSIYVASFEEGVSFEGESDVAEREEVKVDENKIKPGYYLKVSEDGTKYDVINQDEELTGLYIEGRGENYFVKNKENSLIGSITFEGCSPLFRKIENRELGLDEGKILEFLVNNRLNLYPTSGNEVNAFPIPDCD